MGVRGRDAGPLLVSDEEMEAASKFFYANVAMRTGSQSCRFLSCILLLQSLNL